MAGLWTAATLHDPQPGADFDGGNGHRTGWGGGPSIDQVVAQAYGTGMPYQKSPSDAMQETRYRSVALGVQTGGPTSLNRMTYVGDNQPIHPETNPKAAFDRLFMGVTPSGGTPPMEDPAVTRARSEQKAIVDLIKGDLGRIRTRVGAEEYRKIDAHLEGVLAIERRRPADDADRRRTGCTIPATPPMSSSNGGSNANYPNQIKSDDRHRRARAGVRHHARADAAASYGFSNVTAHLAQPHQRPPHDVARRGRSAHGAAGDRQLVLAAVRGAAAGSWTPCRRGTARCSTTR